MSEAKPLDGRQKENDVGLPATPSVPIGSYEADGDSLEPIRFLVKRNAFPGALLRRLENKAGTDGVTGQFPSSFSAVVFWMMMRRGERLLLFFFFLNLSTSKKYNKESFANGLGFRKIHLLPFDPCIIHLF